MTLDLAEQAVIRSLTPREREFLRWAKTGTINRHIATYMGVSENTVRTWSQTVQAKLEVHSKVDMIRRAYELGVIEL